MTFDFVNNQSLHEVIIEHRMAAMTTMVIVTDDEVEKLV